MDAREFRGMQIAATMQIRRSTHGWIVPSQVGHGRYTVSPVRQNIVDMGAADPWTCTCPDYELRGKPCKHIFAVEMTVRHEYNSDGEMVAEKDRRQRLVVEMPEGTRRMIYFALPDGVDIKSVLQLPDPPSERDGVPITDRSAANLGTLFLTALGRIVSEFEARWFE